MFLSVIIFVIVLERSHVYGIDGNSFVPRTNCFPNEQPNCNEEFIAAYPELSKSVTGDTNATTWFLLFTRKNPDIPDKLHKCGGKLPPNSNFDPNNRLIIILGAYVVGICDIALYRELLVQFLEREDANVLAIDFSWGSHLDYETAKLNIKIVAKQTAIVLSNIQNETGITKEKIYIVALSLGAQLAGLIGYLFPVGRITGLDPAGLGYTEDKPLKDRLDQSDADFVDVWHTNGGQCFPFFGISYDAGHVNFYINGGPIQPSCLPYGFVSFIKGDLLYAIGTLVLPTLCFHVQSAQYYKVSINPGKCQFVGVKNENYTKFKSDYSCSCGRNGDDCLIMGFDTDKYINRTQFPQKYYVRTSLHCPYCNNRGLHLEGYKSTYKKSLQLQRRINSNSEN